MSTPKPSTIGRFLSQKQVLAFVPVTRARILALEKPGKGMRLSDSSNSKVAWYQRDIVECLATRAPGAMKPAATEPHFIEVEGTKKLMARYNPDAIESGGNQ